MVYEAKARVYLMTQRNSLYIAATMVVSAMLILAVSPPARAGSNDPIERMGIAILKAPASRPATKFSLTGRQIKRFNHLKGVGRSKYLASIIVAHLAKKGLTKGGLGAVTSMTRILGKSWCGPCKYDKPRKVSIHGPNFKNGITAMISAEF